MKMTTSDYLSLKRQIKQTLEETGASWEEYQKSGLSHTRWRWDLLWHCDTITPRLYQYLDDAHIDTALRKATKELRQAETS